MNKCVMATCIVVIMITTAFTTISATMTDGALADYSDGTIEVSSQANNSLYEYNGVEYVVLKSAEHSEYEGKTLKCNRAIIDVEKIKEDAFRETALTEIILTSKVAEIDPYAFQNCTELVCVSKLGTTDTVFSNCSFYGCDNLRLLDVRYSDNVSIGTTGDESTTMLLTHKSSDDYGMAHNNAVFVTDTNRAMYLFRLDDSNDLQLVYHGDGLLQCKDVYGNLGTWSHSKNNCGDVYTFDLNPGKDMRIGFRNVKVTYDAFGYSSFNKDVKTDIPLSVPTLAPGTDSFPGWINTTNGVNVGNKLELDEVDAHSTGTITLGLPEPLPVISYDLSGNPDLSNGMMTDTAYTKGMEFPSIDDGGRYTLTGWNIEGDSSNTLYDAGTTIQIYGDMTLVGVWEPNPDAVWNVTYLNISGEPATASTQVQHNGTFTITDMKPTDMTDDSVFEGWLLDGILKSVGDSFTVTSDVSLNPQVRGLKDFTVTYVVGTETVLSESVKEAYSHRINALIPEGNSENLFSNWKDASTGTTYVYGDSFVMTGDVTLNAEWRLRESYEVTFMSGSEEHHVATAREGIPFTVNVTDPTGGDGFFKGWVLDGTSIEVNAGDILTITEDTKISAIWGYDTFTVTYVSDGQAVHSHYATEGETIQLSIPLSKPKYILSKWDDGVNEHDVDSSYMVMSNVTFIAIWIEDPTIQVTFHLEDGSEESYERKPGVEFLVQVDPGTNEGYEFIGWSIGYNNAATVFNGQTISFTEDTELYPEWKEKVKVTLKFFQENENTTDMTLYAGDSIYVDVNPGTKEGHNFTGWTTHDESITILNGHTYTFDEGLDFFPLWIEEPKVQLVFHKEDLTIEVIKGEVGQIFDIQVDPGTKSNHIFIGWSEGIGNDATILNGESYPFEEDKELYPVWAKDPTIHITFYPSSGDKVVIEGKIGDSFLIDVEPGIKEGSEFEGWSTNMDDTILSNGSSYVFEKDTNLFTVWKEIPKNDDSSDDDPWIPSTNDPATQPPNTDSTQTSGSGGSGSGGIGQTASITVVAGVVAAVLALMMVALRRS